MTPAPAVHGVRGGKVAAGSGPAVLLLHGVGTASGSFWAQFEKFFAVHPLVVERTRTRIADDAFKRFPGVIPARAAKTALGR